MIREMSADIFEISVMLMLWSLVVTLIFGRV